MVYPINLLSSIIFSLNLHVRLILVADFDALVSPNTNHFVFVGEEEGRHYLPYSYI